MEGKIKTYMFSGQELIEEEEEFDSVVAMVAYAMMKNDSEVKQMVEKWVSQGKRIIYFYPGLSSGDVSGMKYIGDVPDGAMYLG